MHKKSDVQPRKLKAAVISDVHLGTYGCKAKELQSYLKTIQPEILVLNGDIIDIWRFSKSYFPKAHLKVVRTIVKMMEKGTKVYYIPGNHDEVMRRFSGTSVGNFHIVNKLVLSIDGHRSWIFHGDVFDVIMVHSKWLAKLGAAGYGLLTMVNRGVNALLKAMGKPKISLSKKVKDAVKGSGGVVSRFEQTVSEIAISKGYQYVICGHIHRPAYKTIEHGSGKVTYLNSGDWVEHYSALEYQDHFWKLVVHDEAHGADGEWSDDTYLSPTEKQLYAVMLNEVLSD